MKTMSFSAIALMATVLSQGHLDAAESETFVGTAAASGRSMGPPLVASGKRYELQASDKADASVTETLARFSKGDTGTCPIQGTRGPVNGADGIILDEIAPAETFPAADQTAPTVTSKVVTVGDRKYTVYEYTDPESKTYCVVIPEGLKTVRGLLVNSNYYAGDSRGDWTFCHCYREFMHLHDFAVVSANGTCPHVAAFKGFRKSLQEISVASRHAELVNAPYAAVGFSAGGGFASTLMTMEPEKTITAGIIGARYNFTRVTPPAPAPLLGIPSVLITGEQEHLNDSQISNDPNPHKVDDVFVPHRPMGGEYAWIEKQGIGHEYTENRQDLVIMPLMDLAVRTRYPKDGDPTKGPVKLISIDPATGWVADNTTWRSGLTKILTAKQFKGDLGHSSWLQNADIAFIYRAYATYDNPLKITSPGPCGPGTPSIDPGSDVPITVDVSKFPEWKKLELYDGAKKLGTVTSAPAQFIATNLTPGYHVFSVLGTDSQETIRSSDPVMVIVRKLPTSSDPRR